MPADDYTPETAIPRGVELLLDLPRITARIEHLRRSGEGLDADSRPTAELRRLVARQAHLQLPREVRDRAIEQVADEIEGIDLTALDAIDPNELTDAEREHIAVCESGEKPNDELLSKLPADHPENPRHSQKDEHYARTDSGELIGPYETVEECEREREAANREYAIEHLTRDESGHLRTPGSRYGHTVSDCAPVAFALASILRRENSEAGAEPFTATLDEAMGLVVNNSDDVLNLIREHGTEDERETVEDVIRAEKIAAQEALGYDEAEATERAKIISDAAHEERDGREELTESEAESRFDEHLSEAHETVTICGLEMEQGRILKECDNIAYREAFNNWVDAEDIEIV